jgi:hypothetical protein
MLDYSRIYEMGFICLKDFFWTFFKAPLFGFLQEEEVINEKLNETRELLRV